MNREEILEKSRKENSAGDERAKDIERIGNENAYLAIMIVFLVLAGIALLQKMITGSQFADDRIFLLAFVIGMIGRSATRYMYLRKRIDLVSSILAIIVSIMQLVAIIWL